MTRNVVSAFRRNRFENPTEAARKAINVIFVAKVCTQLQAELSLLQPRIISKRRRSATSAFVTRKMKLRRMSCAVTGNVN